MSLSHIYLATYIPAIYLYSTTFEVNSIEFDMVYVLHIIVKIAFDDEYICLKNE